MVGLRYVDFHAPFGRHAKIWFWLMLFKDYPKIMRRWCMVLTDPFWLTLAQVSGFSTNYPNFETIPKMHVYMWFGLCKYGLEQDSSL